jgi:hypothetical protein
MQRTDHNALESQTPKESSPMQLHAIGNGACGLCQGLAGMKIVRSDELLQGQREMFILHDGAVYRLLRTRNNKLILQK